MEHLQEHLPQGVCSIVLSYQNKWKLFNVLNELHKRKMLKEIKSFRFWLVPMSGMYKPSTIKNNYVFWSKYYRETLQEDYYEFVYGLNFDLIEF